MKAEFQFTAEDFDTLRGIIREEIRQELVALKPKYYTKDEAASLLNISRNTIDNWAKKGLISKCKIENRVFFAEEEIKKMMSSGNPKW